MTRTRTRTRTTLAAALLAAALLAAGCGAGAGAGGGATPTTGGHRSEASVRSAQGVRYAACMRTHGVPSFPDPAHDGAFELPAGLDPKAPAFRRAAQACARLQPRSLMINARRPS